MHEPTITVVGMGYVGLPLAAALSHHYKVYGFDTSHERIDALIQGMDSNNEVSDLTQLTFSTFIEECPANIYIVAVPTPVLAGSVYPDFDCLVKASTSVGGVLRSGDLVIYESTVYPGAIEEHCIPILETESGLKSPGDFGVGYSPERINPGDAVHTVDRIDKIVSGQTADITRDVGLVYSPILRDCNVWGVSSIKTAEMAKLIENCQRDVNIAFINEVSALCRKLGLSTEEVLAAAKTKWNFVDFEPGPVGGHCIPVDPHYFMHIAARHGVDVKVTPAAREVNKGVPTMIGETVMRSMWTRRIGIQKAQILVLGLTFKENCKDVRNSPSMDLIEYFRVSGTSIIGYDPMVKQNMSVDFKTLGTFDAIVVMVKHDMFLKLSATDFNKLSRGKAHVFDVKNIYNPVAFKAQGVELWQM